MNKYTKNQIWFNLEKIISVATLMSIIVLTVLLMNSCTTTETINYSKLKHKNVKWNCPTFAKK